MSVPFVIVVPGTGGSELFTPPSFFGLGPNIKVWLGYATLLAGGWRWLGLSADGVTPTTPLTGPLVAGGPLSDYYGQLCNLLQGRGYFVASPKLDWRGTIQADGMRLAMTIRQFAEYAPIHLVAHSRGGLVVRYALADLATTAQLGLVGSVAGLGVPHLGSWAAAALLAGWDETAQLLGKLILGIEGPLMQLLGSGGLQTVILSWPAAYYMLPSPTDPQLTIAEEQALYTATGWASEGVAVSAAWLASAQATWPTVPPSPPSVRWLDVVGTGFSTAEHLLSSGPPLRSTDMSYTDQGDGTVLMRSATQPGRPSYVTPTRHSALPYTEDVVNVLDQWIKGTYPATTPAQSVPAPAVSPARHRATDARRNTGDTGPADSILLPAPEPLSGSPSGR